MGSGDVAAELVEGDCRWGLGADMPLPAAAGRVPAMHAQCQPEQANPRTRNSLRPPTSQPPGRGLLPSDRAGADEQRKPQRPAPDPRLVRGTTSNPICNCNKSTVLAMPLV